MSVLALIIFYILTVRLLWYFNSEVNLSWRTFTVWRGWGGWINLRSHHFNSLLLLDVQKMDSGESGCIDATKCPDLSALKSLEAMCNKRKAENLSDQNPLKACMDTCKTETKSSPRFGALSHHSFFSRHNPHPQRVTHIPGERPHWCVFYVLSTNKAVFSEL